METRRKNGPLDACKKFFKEINVSSPFSAIRRNPHRRQESKPAANPAPSPSPAVKTRRSAENTKPVESASAHYHKTPKNREAAEVDPIKFDYSGQLPSVAPREEPSSQHVQIKKVATRLNAELAQKYNHRPDNTPTHAVGYGRQGPQISSMQSNKQGANKENEFTDYINRAGTKIRTMSSIGGKHNSSSASGEEDSKDRFLDYINRAKSRMLRTMSSFVGGRRDSMK